jgi:hypothetical protein
MAKAMDLNGRPLSRALGDSKILAYAQGLEFWDSELQRYEHGKFFTAQDW